MAPATRPLVWHQLRFALPLAQDAAVGLVERVLADGSLGRVVLELRASGGQATWALGSHVGERLVSVVRELVPGCRVSRGFSRRAVDQAVVVSARPAGVGLATERLVAVVRAVLAALAVTAEGEELVVQLQLGQRFSPEACGRVEPQGWLELLGLLPVPSLSGERGRRMRAQVGRHRAAVCLRLGVRAGDVVVLDPTNPCPVGFNPLAGPPELAVVTAEAVLGVLAELFRNSWGIRTADVLSAALLTLARIPQATLVWLVPLLTNPAFRRRVLALAPPDPLGTDVFWQGYEAKPVRTQAVEVAPVLNKLRQLMLRPGLRAMLGQAQPRFGLADLLERRRIVVVNLNQGLLGAGAARLLGTLLISQLWQHLLARQAEPPQRRQIVSVYIDEVQAFLAGLPGSLADALAQARSLGAAFHLAHQYRGQLSAEMMQAVETNTRSKVYFALSATDAAAAARLAPELEAADFQLLAQYQAYATVMHQGHRSGWFSLATRPAPPAVRDPALLYAASHARYGIPAKQTEADLIALTSGSTPAAVDANEQRNPTTTLQDTTTVATDVTDDVLSGEAGDGAEPKPGTTLDEAGPDGTSNGTEADGSISGTRSGRSRPAIGRRRRP